MCPKGDDPFTLFTDYRTIILNTTVSSGYLNGTLKFTFNDESFFFPAAAGLWTEDQCRLALQGLSNVEEARCTRGVVTSQNTTTYTMEFISFPISPQENNIYTHDGNPALSSFSCDTSLANTAAASGIKCIITDVVRNSLPGNVTLSSYF